MNIKNKEEYEKEEYYVEDMIDNGYGVCKSKNGDIFFVKKALYGQTVTLKERKKKGKIYLAEVDKIIKQSEYVKENNKYNPAAPIQDLDYDCEIYLKVKNVQNKLKRIGKLDINLSERDIIFDKKNRNNYRNKSRFKVNSNDELGYFEVDSNKFIKIEECILSSKNINEVYKTLNKIINVKKEDSLHKKEVLEVVLREDLKENIQIIFNINYEKIKEKNNKKVTNINENMNLIEDDIIRLILKLNQKNKLQIISGIVNYIDKKGKTISKCIYGVEDIVNNIGEYKFNISPFSFFQVNKYMTKKLYDVVKTYLKKVENYKKITEKNLEKKNIKLLDLYCGVGTISIYLNNEVDNIIGVEIVKSAIENANKNVELNNLDLKRFNYISSSADSKIDENLKNIDVVIVDPPRKGLEKNVITSISKNKVNDVIYVSCDPGTLARDLKLFTELGYMVSDIKLVDMFPNTMHVECVVLMSKGYP